MHGNVKDLVGQRFGRLVVKQRIPPTTSHDGKKICGKWLCECDCGGTAAVLAGNLTRGNSTSCGCYISEVTSKRNTTHGKTKHPIYKAWCGMIRRCEFKGHQAYPRYGGRGIKVQEPWRSSFQSFFDDMSPTWEPGLEIGRIDSDKDYAPGNCRWETRKEQMNNFSRNVFLDTPRGRMTLSQAGEAYGINQETIRTRLKRGWDLELALTAPNRSIRHKSSSKGAL